MKSSLHKFKIFACLVVFLASLITAPRALAYSPYLSISGTDGNLVLTVNSAQPNSSIQLTYTPSGSNLATVISNFGYTDNGGNFTTNISTGSYGLANATQVFVTVAGQRSNSVSVGNYNGGCGYSNCTYANNLSLSQTSVNLNIGQSTYVTAYYNNNYGYNYSGLYISNNSNSSVVSASVSGNQINLYGLASGSSTVSVCSNYSSQCGYIYVTVGIGGNGCYGGYCGNLSLSQTSVNLNVGQSTYVTTYNYSGSSLYISANSNSSVVSSSVSGNQINLYGLTNGSATITVCTNYGSSQCASIYVTVGGSNGGLSLSQTNISLNVGQNTYVSAYNSSGSLYVSSNSNSSVVSTNTSGNQVTFYGLANGSSNVQICDNASRCATVYVTVGGGGCYGSNCGGNVWFNPSNPSLYVGQSLAVSINSAAYSGYYGGSSVYYYISSNSNSSVVSASVSGTALNLYANANGSSNITVCSSSLGYCGTLYVTVGGSGYGGNNTVSIRDNYFSPNNLTVNVGTTVLWQNNGSMTHTVTSDNNYFNSGNINSGGSYSYTFNTVGTFPYHCIFHGSSGGSGMSGTITVVSGGAGGSLSFSQTNPTLGVGQSISIAVNNNYSGYLYVSSNSNQGVASASLSGNTLNIYGLTTGYTTITVCSNNSSQCGSVYVSVTSGGGSTNIILNPSSLNLNVGQSSTVNITGSYGNYYGNYYISSNSNSSVAYATLSGNTLSVTGNSLGYTSMAICQYNSNQCATLSVNVNNSGYNYGYGSNNLTLQNTNVPNMTVGQYYSFQLQASGGTPPYNFYISSGSLPVGLSLSSSGLIYGTSQSTLGVSVNINITDNYGHSGYGTIYFGTTGGTSYGSGGLQYPGGVMGASTYPNGSLISEHGTVYIVYKNTKTGFASASVFKGLGYSFSNVIEVGNSGLIDSGYVVRTAAASHPWGSWIKSGSTIYFVSESGLIPVTSMNYFAANGGQLNLVVPANHYDFTLPILPVMTVYDSRLQ